METITKLKKAIKMKKSDIDEVIARIQERTKEVDPGSEEFAKLRKDLEQEYRNKKLVKELRHGGLSADKILMVVTIFVIAGFAFCLDLESPKALKIAQLVLRLPICKV